MATLDEAALQLAETLPIEVIPAKLRCGSCNKLAINALKLPCCAQSICEPCSLALPETCPICSHSPVSAEDCTPIKSLRLSVKAFLKNEQKKRNKDAEAPVPATDASAEQAAPTEAPPVEGDKESQAHNATNGETEITDGVPINDINVPSESQGPQDGVNAGQSMSAEPEGEQEDEEDEDDNVIITTERPEQEAEEQQQYGGDESHAQGNDNQEMEQTFDNGNGNGNFGFGQNQQGFGGMDFNNMNNFNPMMMQNGMGMPNFAMGMQNMMGMPGMNMDPSMMFNGGFGGMGGMNDMSMMNMGMGMGNMGGFGGMPGMGMGGGPGFFPGNGGYNQQSFGNNMHQNFHHNRGYGGRPYGRGFRGRGWGGYNRGRGNWQNHGHFQGNQNFMNQQYQQQQHNFQGGDDNLASGQQQANRRGSPSYEPMNGADASTDHANQDVSQTKPEDTGDSNLAATNGTNEAGYEESEVKGLDADGNEVEKPQDAEGVEGKHDFLFERSPAQAIAQTQAELEDFAEASVEDVAKDVSMDDSGNEPVTTGSNAEGGAESNLFVDGGQEEQAGMQGTTQGQYYDQEYQQGHAYGARGRGGFQSGRGGFRGRGGAYGYVATPPVFEQTAAPPANAPIGPKAYREGKPNSGWYSRPPPAAVPAASPATEVIQQSSHDDRGRTRSRSRAKSDRGIVNERTRSPDEYDETDEARHEKRRRRDDRYEDERNGDANGDKTNHKGKSRSETPDEEKSRRRHEDEDRHRSRSYRERSRDKHRRRHRSRSPPSDREGEVDGSRRKSKSDRRRESRYDESEYARDKERSRRSSRREDDYERDSKDRSNNSSKHARSGRDDRDREREREKHRPVLEEPQDEIGFKIKGSKSAAMQQAGLDGTSMGPPTTSSRDRDGRRQSSAAGTPNTPAGDPYAEERERRQRERLDRENTLRRQSTQSLGKRTSRDEDEFDAPMGPKSDAGRSGKKARRKVGYKYEDEIAEDSDRRWR